VIPAFNEEKRLEAGIRPLLDVLKARGEPFEIIVVDDGSKDGTVEVANRLQRHHPEIKLEQLGVNRGKGAAVRHGALRASGTYILLADADGATEASDLEKLRARIDDGADVAIGSRRLAEAKVDCPWIRRLLRYCLNLPVRYYLFDGIADTQCGFKMFTAASASFLFSQQRLERFSFDLELLYVANVAGMQVDEVPVTWSDVEGSKVHLLRDGFRMLMDVFRIRNIHGAPRVRPR
jgi:dolichyl-phosphate beta-glucosyltransferase